MRRYFLLLCLIAAVALTGCTGAGNRSVPTFSSQGGKVKVAASFYPIYEAVKIVGGDQVDAINLVPAGTEPHEWEPTPKHITTLNQASLLVYSGAGMEHWVSKTVSSLDNKNLTVVEASKGFALMQGSAASQAAEAFDPHVWLDPLGMVHEVEAIRDALIKADPNHTDTYEANAAAYVAQLKSLDGEFKSGLSGCKRGEFFTSHAAFGYLAHRYALEQHPIMGLTPDAEPKPKELAQIVSDAKEHQIKHIFFETLVSDKVAKMVAKEVGAQTLVLNPYEGLTDEEIKAGQNYLTVMRENLANLKIALECGK